MGICECSLIGDGLHGNGVAAPFESVSNDQNLGVTVTQSRHDRAGPVAAEERHDRSHRAMRRRGRSRRSRGSSAGTGRRCRRRSTPRPRSIVAAQAVSRSRRAYVHSRVRPSSPSYTTAVRSGALRAQRVTALCARLRRAAAPEPCPRQPSDVSIATSKRRVHSMPMSSATAVQNRCGSAAASAARPARSPAPSESMKSTETGFAGLRRRRRPRETSPGVAHGREPTR